MDQDDVRRLIGKRLESGTNGSLPRCATAHRRLILEMTDSLIENIGIIRIAHRLNREDIRMGAKWLHRPRKDGFTADGSVLLGAACAGAKSAAGGNDDGGSPF